ncbi:MAG: hypothetical protein LBI04_08065 [Treponema sp.]|nr:hypothetical protein [Treponema sp.]
MKKLTIFLLVSVLFAGTAFAQKDDTRQNRDNRNRNDRKREAATVTVEGVLQLEKGVVAVASGDSVYYVPMLTRYIGFIDGLKEGTKVSVQGFQSKSLIRPVKVTINGKSYDFPDYGNMSRNDSKSKDPRFSHGRGDPRHPRNVYHRGRQGIHFNRGGFGGNRR